MKLQQLRYLREVVRRGLNVSEAAEALFTSQPGISKQIRMLEDELGVQMLKDADNLRAVGEEFGNEDTGALTLATTPTQARYALPPVVQQFMQRHPRVRMSLREGSPEQIIDMVSAGGADIGIVTESYPEQANLVLLPCYQWNRAVFTPADHPLLKEKPLTLEAIARYPVVTYDFAFNGDSPIKKAFDARNLKPNVALTAVDADVIKSYVELGVGVGILAKMAYDPARDSALRLLDAAHLFEASTTRIAIRRNAYLRRYVYDFVELFAPHLSRSVVEKTMRGPGENYEL
jgi:LysR family cys regulon transcriptional activator